MNDYQNYREPQFQGEPQFDKKMGLKDWIITLLVTGIPCVGTIMLLIWAFSPGDNITRSNYAKAMLLVTVVTMFIGIILAMITGVFSATGSYYLY